jgi:cytidyltransferase-like protein
VGAGVSRTVLSVGTFDLLHCGHVSLFSHCRRVAGDGGKVVIGVNTSEFAAKFKPAPVQSTHERAFMVGACRDVDQVVLNDSESLAPLITETSADFLLIGQDWATRDYYAQIGLTQAQLDDAGVTLLYVPRPAGTISSTEVKARVRAAR